jgi:hypothetical protein
VIDRNAQMSVIAETIPSIAKTIQAIAEPILAIAETIPALRGPCGAATNARSQWRNNGLRVYAPG